VRRCFCPNFRPVAENRIDTPRHGHTSVTGRSVFQHVQFCSFKNLPAAGYHRRGEMGVFYKGPAIKACTFDGTENIGRAPGS